ncbi:Crp/Fnr family transcriptional regulator [Bowmanella dokdonensis]|uniref:Crp/Fnr family transcriptional regulator n=1 Tax=Bowmanella dokdonensis TaxID=751969 RepID=A0A939IP81_9ALTE|nr:Crp/Fnr family transcriptional regulator [Bowmanella dokdonensis]MBN7825630.1 Crp/Fnr family transcriptional regulator [Bowmanella dokdonensis]
MVNNDLLQMALKALHLRMQAYSPLSDATWRDMQAICRLRQLQKGEHWLKAGERPDCFGFVYQGLMRVYALAEQGWEYNKNFFAEGRFPGSMTALLEGKASSLAAQALEDCILLEIDFAGFRELLTLHHDLALFQIQYLETHWLKFREKREIALVQDDATSRYERFLQEHGKLADRLPQYHIASHLGITPTQLSRIRKNRHSQPM